MIRFFLLALFLVSLPMYAQFVPDGFISVSSANHIQEEPSITSDGTGGYVMAWRDYRNGSTFTDSSDIYIQRFDGNGNMLWATDGIPVCTAYQIQRAPKVVLCKTSDNQPRIMVIWLDNRIKTSNSNMSKIFCQAYDLNGNPQYTANGVEVADCNGINFVYPDAVPALGGSRVVFVYNRRRDPQLYANYFLQAINPDDGTLLYAGNGTRLASGIDAGGDYSVLLSEIDNSEQIQVAWAIFGIAGYSSNGLLFAQRINPQNGSKVWQNDLAIMTSYTANSFDLERDIITWSDNRNNQSGGTGTDIFAQKINANGTAAWTNQGAEVFVGLGSQQSPQLSRNSFGETFITWNNLYTPGNNQYDLYVQKLDILGNKLFGANGQLLSTSTGNTRPNLVAQSDGGAISLSVIGNSKNRLLVHRLSRDGRWLWGNTGREIGSTISGIISDRVLPLPLSDGGAVVGFNSYNGYAGNIYAAKFNYCENPPSSPEIITQYAELNTNVTLTATGCSGIVNWYDTDHQQGVIVSTGPTFSFTATGRATYYAECVENSCASLLAGAGQVRIIIHSAKSGAWDQPDTWNCNCVPEALDKVVVESGHTVTLPNNYTANAFELRQEGILQHSENSVLQLNE